MQCVRLGSQSSPAIMAQTRRAGQGNGPVLLLRPLGVCVRGVCGPEKNVDGDWEKKVPVVVFHCVLLVHLPVSHTIIQSWKWM